MRVTFLSSGLEHLGVQALSAYLRAHGHQTALVHDVKPFSSNTGADNALLARLFEPSVESIAERVLATRPDLLAVSSYTVTHRWSMQVASLVKKRSSLPIVFGGPHPTAAPRETILQSSVDAVVEGEGEEALLELVESIEGGRIGRADIRNCWFQDRRGEPLRIDPRAPIADLDALPFADKALFYRQEPAFEREYGVVARRGCPYRCSFCEYSNESAHQPGVAPVRRRSVSHLVAELAVAAKSGRVRRVFFWDPVFTLDLRWMEEFADEYRRRVGLPFECYSHPRAFSAPMASVLARAGCQLVRLGVQSVNDSTLADHDRQGNRAAVTAATRALQEHQIPYSLDHILGLPGDTLSDQRDAVRFYCDLRPERIQLHWMTYFPGTTAFDRAVAAGSFESAQVRALLHGEGLANYGVPQMLASLGRGVELTELMRLEFLFHALAAIPAAWVRWLLDSGAYRAMPRGLLGRHFAYAIAVLAGGSAARERLRDVLAVIAGSFGATRRRLASGAPLLAALILEGPIGHAAALLFGGIS